MPARLMLMARCAKNIRDQGLTGVCLCVPHPQFDAKKNPRLPNAALSNYAPKFAFPI